jgi:hypothetical protein
MPRGNCRSCSKVSTVAFETLKTQAVTGLCPNGEGATVEATVERGPSGIAQWCQGVWGIAGPTVETVEAFFKKGERGRDTRLFESSRRKGEKEE